MQPAANDRSWDAGTSHHVWDALMFELGHDGVQLPQLVATAVRMQQVILD